VDPPAQYVRGVLRSTVGELCQVFELGTFGREVASALPETGFDVGRDIRGLIRCTGDVCYNTPELAQVFRNGPGVKIFLLRIGDYVITEHVGNEHTGRVA
jgi:hypothetical protein